LLAHHISIREPYAAKGRLPIALGRGAFSYLADRVGMAKPYLCSAIALGFWVYATLTLIPKQAFRAPIKASSNSPVPRLRANDASKTCCSEGSLRRAGLNGRVHLLD
jgi:hypothetical protein